MSSEPTDLLTGSPAAPAGPPTQPETPDHQPATAATAGSTDPVTRDPAAPGQGGSGPARAAKPDAEPAGGRADRGANTGLSAMLLPELQRMAQSMGITGTARMRKSQLVEAIQNRQGGQTAAPHATRRSAALDNSAQRVASAGADAPRHREQDDMEPDRTTQQGPGEGTHAAASGGGGADSQLAFDQPGTAGRRTAADAAPAAPGTPGGTGTAGGPPGQFPGGTGGTPPTGGTGAQGSPRARSQAGGPGGLGGDTQVAATLTRLLRGGAAGYRWAAATVGSESAAPLQLDSGDPVMAIGGFNGSDGAPTLGGFQHLVAAGEIHYFVGANQASFGGGSGAAAQITAWVRAHFTAETVGGVTVYDLTRAR